MEQGFVTELIESLRILLEHHGVLTTVVSVFFLGENAAIAIFALSAQGFIHPVTAVLSAFTGSILSDIFWFFIAERYLRHSYDEHLAKATAKKSSRFFIRLVDTHFFLVLIFIKFLIGMRLVLTLYIVLKNKIPFWKKIILNAIGTTFFLGAIFPVGWYLGKGFSNALSVQHGIAYVLTVIVAIMITATVLPKLIEKVIERFYKEHHE
jgi:membrane protein DedA with SNARE-associated domain